MESNSSLSHDSYGWPLWTNHHKRIERKGCGFVVERKKNLSYGRERERERKSKKINKHTGSVTNCIAHLGLIISLLIMSDVECPWVCWTVVVNK